MGEIYIQGNKPKTCSCHGLSLKEENERKMKKKKEGIHYFHFDVKGFWDGLSWLGNKTLGQDALGRWAIE